MSNEQQPWTDEQLDRLARNLVWRAGGSTENAMRMGLRVGRDAWQTDHDTMQSKLDAANECIRTLEAQLKSANEEYMDELQERNPFLYDALRNESEADDE